MARNEGPELSQSERVRRERAVKRYVKLGEELYGLGTAEQEGEPDRKRKARRYLRYQRREIEHRYPEVRQLEKDTYRTGSTHSKAYIPKLFVTYSSGDAGSVVYPDGSREQHAEHYFSDKAGLREILAELLYYDRIHPEATEVITAGSALPLVTFRASLM